MSRARVVVLGANGFVGRAVAARLVESDHEVDGVTRREECVIRGVRAVTLDEPRDVDALERVLVGADAVVNAAGRAHVLAETESDPLTAFRQVNVELARAIATAAARTRVRLYIEIGSVAAVAERSSTPLTGSTPPRPVSAYGVSKLEAENVAMSAAQQTRVVVLRPPMVYGPGMKGNPLRLFDLLRRGGPLPLGAVHNSRSMLFVGNLAAAVAAVVAKQTPSSGRYFVADSEPVSTTFFAQTAARALGVDARFLPVPVPVLRAAGRVGDLIQRFRSFPMTSSVVDRLTSDLVLDTSDLARDFDFVAPTQFVDGIEQTARWYLSNRAASTAA